MMTGTHILSRVWTSRRRARATALVTGAVLLLTMGAPVPATVAAAPGAIAGTVTDNADQPLGGIEVAVFGRSAYGDVLLDQVVTNAAGDYQIDDLAPDAHLMVRFSDPTGEHATEYYRDLISGVFPTWVAVTDGGTTSPIDASLEPGSTLSGRLTRAGGTPVSGGTVTLWWSPSPQSFVRVSDHVADADGNWTILGVRGGATYGLEFRDPVTGATEAWNDRAEIISSTPLVVPLGEDVPHLDAMLGGVVTSVSAPAISGTPQVGQTLTASSTWQPADTTVTYRWIVGDDTSPADDPRGSTYVPTAADVGRSIRVEATGTRGAGWTPATAWSAATAPVAAAPVAAAPVAAAPVVTQPVLTIVNERLPRIKGTLRVGRVVRVTTGAWTPYPKKLTFRWYAGKRAIKGATRQRFTLTKKQAGKRLRVVVTASAPKHESLAVTTKRTGKVRR